MGFTSRCPRVRSERVRISFPGRYCSGSLHANGVYFIMASNSFGTVPGVPGSGGYDEGIVSYRWGNKTGRDCGHFFIETRFRNCGHAELVATIIYNYYKTFDGVHAKHNSSTWCKTKSKIRENKEIWWWNIMIFAFHIWVSLTHLHSMPALAISWRIVSCYLELLWKR